MMDDSVWRNAPHGPSAIYALIVPKSQPHRGRHPRVTSATALRPIIATAIFSTVYAVFSVRQHQLTLTTGYDLGVFEQIARGYSNLEIPRIPLVNGAVMAADHFSPILALLGLPYAVFPSPVTLLVIQAFLIAVGVIPLMAWAERSAGKSLALCVAVIYGLSPGIASAVGFDFHEIAFAVPLLAFSMSALGQRKWTQSVLWALPLVLVKEDLGFTVAAIGIYIFCHRARRLGAATAMIGALSSLVAVLLILPMLSVSGTYFYQEKMASGGILGIAQTGITDLDVKFLTVTLVIAPTAFIALRSPLILMALPTLGWRFVADNPAFWQPGFHYDAVLVPIVVAAFIDGISRTNRARARRIILAAALASTLVLASAADFGRLASGSFWTTNPRAETIHRIVDLIPDHASVAATNNIVPQLTARTITVEFGSGGKFKGNWQHSDWKSADWILVDTRAPAQFDEGNAAAFRKQLGNGFQVVAEEDGIRLAHRAK